MARKIDLMGYLPSFLTEYKEIQELMGAEEPEIQTLAEEVERLLDNLFIVSADADGIRRFEKIVGILPAVNDTLEMRRTRLFTRWNDVTPYTFKTLWNKIVNIQGNENIEINFSNPYEITIITRLEQRGMVDDLAYLLKAIMPCNLKVISLNRLEGQTGGGFGYNVGFTPTETLFLTNDLNAKLTVNAPENIAVGVSSTENLFATNDLNGAVAASVPENIGVGMEQTNTLFLTNDLQKR